MTRFLTLEQVILFHGYQIDQYGGSHGIRDLALLESAVMRPQSTFAGVDLYPTIFGKAAVLTHSLILNHPFIDGNKRAATYSMIIFLELNGCHLKVEDKELVDAAVSIATKDWDIDKIAVWMKKHSTKIRS
jgi:death on curing protein